MPLADSGGPVAAAGGDPAAALGRGGNLKVAALANPGRAQARHPAVMASESHCVVGLVRVAATLHWRSWPGRDSGSESGPSRQVSKIFPVPPALLRRAAADRDIADDDRRRAPGPGCQCRGRGSAWHSSITGMIAGPAPPRRRAAAAPGPAARASVTTVSDRDRGSLRQTG